MRNIISLLLIVVLFILTPVMFIVTSVRLNVLTSDFLKQELVRLDVYGLATSQIDEQIAKVNIDPQYPITNAELAALSHSIISESWLRQSLETTLDRMDVWLNSSADTPLSLPIDLRLPKQNLTNGVDRLLEEKLPQIQPCPDRRRPKEEQGICQFAGLTLPQLKEQLSRQGLNPDVVNQALPDTLDLANPDLSKIVGPEETNNPDSAADKTDEIKKQLSMVKARYQQATWLLNWAWVIYGLVVVLYLTINALRGWHRLTRWGGALFFVLGLLPLALAVLSGPLFEQLAVPNIHPDPKAPVEVTRMIVPAIRDVRRALFDPLVWPSLGMVVLGLGAIIGAHWIPSPPKTPVKK